MPSLEQLCQQVILDHARAHHGLGTVGGIDASGRQANPAYGNEITLGVQLAPDSAIKRIVWDGDGCSISQASLLMPAELVDERPSTDEVTKAYEAMKQTMHSRNRGVPEGVLDLLGNTAALRSTSQFADRVKCALLDWYVLCNTLAKFGIDITGDRA